MTCIAGVATEGRVYIGGDSAAVDPWHHLVLRRDRKVVRNGEFIIGFTTSYRMGQLLGYRLQVPKRHPDRDVYTYMVCDFVDAVRSCLSDGGYAEKSNGRERGGQFLVGYAGRLFFIDGDFQVGENSGGIDACGSGAQVAIGALAVNAGKPPRERVMEALRAAEENISTVRSPFYIEEM